MIVYILLHTPHLVPRLTQSLNTLDPILINIIVVSFIQNQGKVNAFRSKLGKDECTSDKIRER